MKLYDNLAISDVTVLIIVFFLYFHKDFNQILVFYQSGYNPGYNPVITVFF